MKKQQLLKIINELIQRKKISKSPPLHRQQNSNQIKNQKDNNFIFDYYRKYLRKNKLIPQNHHQKIVDIMKSFEYLDSYVDLNDVINEIEDRMQEKNKNNCFKQDEQTQELGQEQEQDKLQKNVNKQNKTKRLQTQLSQQYEKKLQIIKKADNLIKSSYVDKYLQLNKCDVIMQQLEKTSNQLNNTKYRNNSKGLTFHQLINAKYIQKQQYSTQYQKNNKQKRQKTDTSEQIQKKIHNNKKKSPWDLLQQKKLNNSLQRNNINKYDFENNNTLPLKMDGFLQSTQKHPKVIDRTAILNKAAAYLQMILQRQHFKKWQLKNKNINVIQNLQNISPKKRKISLNKRFQTQKLNTKQSIYTQQDSVCHIKFDTKKSFDRQPNLQKNSQKLSNFSSKTQKLLLKVRKSVPISRTSQLSKQILHSKIQNEILQTSSKASKITFNQNIGQMKSKKNLQKKTLIRQPRYTFDTTKNLSVMQNESQKQMQPKHQQTKIIRDKFTFKKRNIKQRALNKISQFVNDIQHAQKNLRFQSKDCQRQINAIQKKMEFEFSQYKTEKFLNDDKSLQGIQSALYKLPSGSKRYKQ